MSFSCLPPIFQFNRKFVMFICSPLFVFYLVISCIPSTTSTAASPLKNLNNNDFQQNINSIKRPLKILVHSPSISWSHAQYLGRIADTLVEAGHEVVSLTLGRI